MTDDVKRLNYFNLQFLRENDFNDEQRYHVQHLRDHQRLLHTPGIGQGLDVPDPPAGASAITVTAGVAFDNQGRRIVLANNQIVELSPQPAGQSVYIYIGYRESQSEPTSETGTTGYTRWTESPLLEAANTAPDNATKLILARVNRSGTQVSSIDRSERRLASVKGGDLEVRHLTFGSDAISSAGWVQASLNASGTVRIAGNLMIDGTISGNVAVNTIESGDLVDNAVTSAKLAPADGTSGQNTATGSGVKTAHLQDGAVTLQKLALAVQPIISVEGVSNPGGNIDLVNSNAITIAGNNTTKQITIGESHSARNDNPHATTAAQVGALVSVDGVSNPGGNVDFAGSNSITVNSNNTTKQVTIGENHSPRTDNPHATTAAQVGALLSVDGVSNAGGNIDFIGSNAITVTPDNAGKTISFGETHSARTDNPHAITAAQIGALPAGGGTVTGSLGVNGNLLLGITSSGFKFHQLGGDHVIENASVSFRRDSFHRWSMEEAAGSGLRIRQVYSDANTLANRVVMEFPDSGSVAARVGGLFLSVDGGGEQAYLGGDGAGNDVQIGSLRSGTNNLAAYNATTQTYMAFFCSSLSQVSDLTDKTNIAPLANMLPKLKKLRGVSFDWKHLQDAEAGGDSQLGVIAQEVAEVFPEAVTKNSRGKYGVSYTALVPVLIEAVKELSSEVEALRAVSARCDKLEQELTKLKAAGKRPKTK